MNAGPILPQIAEVLNRNELDAILIGDAAACLQGALVSTPSISFVYAGRPIRRAMAAAVAAELGATLQSLPRKHGAFRLDLAGGLLVEICRSARHHRCRLTVMWGVPIRVAVSIPRPHRTIDRVPIRRWQALPPEKRTNFLRVRVGLRGSAL